jgi:hypothetical protein
MCLVGVGGVVEEVDGYCSHVLLYYSTHWPFGFRTGSGQLLFPKA